MSNVVRSFEPLLTKQQLSEALAMSIRWIEKQQAAGMPVRRLGPRANRYSLSEVNAWLDNRNQSEAS